MVIRCCIVCGTYIGDRRINCVRCRECQKEYRNKSCGKIFLDKVMDKRKNSESGILTKLGTTDFDAHRKKDFDQEKRAIKKEMRKLGLQK